MNADMNRNDNQDLREEVDKMRDMLSTALNSLASDHKEDYAGSFYLLLSFKQL
jgi:hypothetical protein